MSFPNWFHPGRCSGLEYVAPLGLEKAGRVMHHTGEGPRQSHLVRKDWRPEEYWRIYQTREGDVEESTRGTALPSGIRRIGG